MVNIAVTGAAGRMGMAITNAVQSNSMIKFVGALEREGSPMVGHDAGEVAGAGHAGVRITDNRDIAFGEADVVIDFTAPESTIKNIEECVHLDKAIVIGTTGLSHHQRDHIKELGAKVRMVMAPNMSVGVNLLFKLVHDAVMKVGHDYDIEIIEAHHRHKKDAPSGTAIRISEVVADALGSNLEDVAVYERRGIIGERQPGEIGIQTIRAGDIVGDHTVILAGPGERIEITHKASSRQNFAVGAVKAALWIVDKANGQYDMQDVLGLKD
ncbi:MAG: 4-hydroxy-tetrahydrodipicolinate reductase [Proteobacteria bacterium]|nr:4-hydroxy-tetrahydrodipicolinate reductase [Pseudomonadota bacterium]